MFQKRQLLLLSEHYFLHKNVNLAPKWLGPHSFTKLKGPCNVELLLANNKRLVVHVNRLKPYLSADYNKVNLSKYLILPHQACAKPKPADVNTETTQTY